MRLCVACLGLAWVAMAAAAAPRFEVTFAAAAHSEPITGRVFVVLSKRDTPEPRLQASNWRASETPFFGLDVEQLRPGQAATIDAAALGYPLTSLKDVPAGDYFVQSMATIYTQFHRSDGHTLWAHMDQWEGQKLDRSPGNLYSAVQKIHFDPASDGKVTLLIDRVIPPVTVAIRPRGTRSSIYKATSAWARPSASPSRRARAARRQDTNSGGNGCRETCRAWWR